MVLASTSKFLLCCNFKFLSKNSRSLSHRDSLLFRYLQREVLNTQLHQLGGGCGMRRHPGQAARRVVAAGVLCVLLWFIKFVALGEELLC
jgi:hypothetical protein